MDGNDLRAILADRGPTLLPGVWDGLSARAAVAQGFDTLFLSGYALAGTHARPARRRLPDPDRGRRRRPAGLRRGADVRRSSSTATPGTATR